MRLTLYHLIHLGGVLVIALAVFLPGYSSGATISNRALYVLHFMNMSTDRNAIVNQSIYVSSFADAKIRLDAPTIDREDYATLDSSNTPSRTYFMAITKNIGVPRGEHVSQNAIRVVSDGTPIWVQVNKMEQGTTAGYLALPVTKHATEFFIPSYNNKNSRGFHTGFAIAGLDDGTCAEVYGVNGDEYTRFRSIHLDSLDVYTATEDKPNFDYTGYLVNSTRPMAVFGGHECAYIPPDKGFCDGIIEQVPPVIEWGREFIIAPIAGRGGEAGYEFRVIAAEQNTEVKYTITGQPEQSRTINRGQAFFSGESHPDHLKSSVYIRCSKKCLVAQYNRGAQADSRNPPDKNNGVEPDPFMMIIPPLDHYDAQMKFSTMKHLDGNKTAECADYISIVAKFDARTGLKLDGKSLNGTWTKVEGKDTYAYYNQRLTPGFHTLTHDNNDEFMAWVYGHGTRDYTGYGFMAGYKITDDAMDDVDGRYDVTPKTTVAPVTTAAPWVLGNWSDSFSQDDLPKYSVIFWGEFHIPQRGSSYSLSQQICSNGYASFFKEKRLPSMASHLKNNIGMLCGPDAAGSVVELSTYPHWLYTEYTRGNLSFALTVTGSPSLTYRQVAACALKLKDYTEDSRNWPTVASEKEVNNGTFLLYLKEYVKNTKCDQVEMGPLNNRVYYRFLFAAGQSWICDGQTVQTYGKRVMTSGGGATSGGVVFVYAMALTWVVNMLHARGL